MSFVGRQTHAFCEDCDDEWHGRNALADATPVLVIDEDEVDPFTGDMCAWPAPIVYWSNGTITLGQDAELP